MKNPLAMESFATKIGNKIKTKKENVEIVKAGFCRAHMVAMNNAIPICAQACSCCWDKVPPEDYEGMATYVGKRTKIGHTSVLEHSNFVVLVDIHKNYEDELLEFLTTVRYLNTEIMIDDPINTIKLLIGGSLRGFADLYLAARNLSNPALAAITSVLYTYAPSAAFEDICNLGYLEKELFVDAIPQSEHNYIIGSENRLEFEKFDIVGYDSIEKLHKNIYNISPSFAQSMTLFDLIKFSTISVMFKDMSRTCTHQLVRHRNAITQESQRYVDYSKSAFASPDEFKPEKYDSNHKYKVRFGPSPVMNLTLKEIGEATCGIYGMLSNPALTGSAALLKEDARAFLPSNVKCRKIYVTFTYKNLLKFLYLREDPAAQAEIRSFATALGDWVRENIKEFNTKELCDLYTKSRIEVFNATEGETFATEEEIVEEEVTPTEEDYAKFAGIADEENE